MDGYIGITNQQWNDSCSKSALQEVICWTRRPSFKVISPGAYYFFLEKGTRLIKGYGIFQKFEKLSVEDCWARYRNSVGAENLQGFVKALGLNGEEESKQRQVGCIVVGNVHWIGKKISLAQCDVLFHHAIVSGRSITKPEVMRILQEIENHSIA